MKKEIQKRAKAPAWPFDGAGGQLPGVANSSGETPAAVGRLLAGAIACGAMVLAGLAGADHWRRVTRFCPAPPVGTSASIAPADRLSLPSVKQPLLSRNLRKLTQSSKQAAHERLAPDSPAPAFSTAARNHAAQMYAALPMSFEANAGQTDPRVKFLAHAPGYSLYLTSQEAVLTLRQPASAQAESSAVNAPVPHSRAPQPQEAALAVRLEFVGGDPAAVVAGRELLPAKSNYLIGNDPTQWHTNVPNYSAVEYRGIYSGVDAVFHGNNQRLEFDFDVAPGADVRTIALKVDGARQIRLDHAGNLLLGMDVARNLVMARPHVYQQSHEGRREIAGHYVLDSRNRIAFALGPYDRAQPLVIDPTLVYSTYLGGGISQESYANAIAVDSSSPNCSGGCAVVAGTAGADTVPFPTTASAYNPGPVPTATNFPFVSKFNAEGSGLVYSTYFGGTYNGYSSDQIYAIAVDSTGAAYFGGISGSYDDTPTTSGSFMPVRPSEKPVPFVAKLSPDGSTLVYGTYLDGTPNNDTDAVSGIAVDSSFSAYVTGNTTATDFPTTTGAFQTVFGASTGIGTAFVTKLSPDGSSLIYSTFLGGNYGENVLSRGAGGAIALDSSNDAYVTGNTYSANFPTKNPYIATCNSPCSDAYVSELNPTGTALVYSTFLGGTTANKESIGMGIAVDSTNSAFVVGTTSFTNFPVTSDVVQSSPGAGFITKLTPDGTGLAYSSYFNGYVDSVAVGPDGSAVLFGFSNTSFGFESTAGAFTLPSCSGGSCFFDFISKLNVNGSELLFSTPIGANLECCGASGVLDPSGTAYIAGSTGSLKLPTTTGSFEPTLPSNYTGYTPYVAKVAFSASSSITLSPATIPSGTAGAAYSQILSATGGTGTVTFAITAGSLPKGLTLTSTGALSGTPTQVGTFPFTVTATDADNDTGSQAYMLRIACQTIAVRPNILAAGTSGTAYPAVTFTETGGIGTTLLAEAGALPKGMSFTARVLSGTPTQTGTFPFQVTATDANSCAGKASDSLTVNAATLMPAVVNDMEKINVNDTETFSDVFDTETISVSDTELVRAYTAVVIAPLPSRFNAGKGTGYATHAYAPVHFTATGGTGALTLSETGKLPKGITFVKGILGGTPATSSVGTYKFSVTATDADGDSATLQGYSITIKAASAFPAVVNDMETIVVDDAETFPDVADTETIDVSDTETVSARDTISIASSAAYFNATSGTGFAGANYGPVTFTATGGAGVLTLSLRGRLPAGITFINGSLAGTPSNRSAGSYPFAIIATDAYGDKSAATGYKLIIGKP
ncbi:MAG: putative Ig domain-containing protein [Terracidiphilus sp.]